MDRFSKLLTTFGWFLACPTLTALCYMLCGGDAKFVIFGCLAYIAACLFAFLPLLKHEDGVIAPLLWSAFLTAGLVMARTGFHWYWPIILPAKAVYCTLMLSSSVYGLLVVEMLLKAVLPSLEIQREQFAESPE